MGFNPSIANGGTILEERKREECAPDGHARENRFPKAITCKQSVNASKIHVSSSVEREGEPRFRFAFVRKSTSTCSERRKKKEAGRATDVNGFCMRNMDIYFYDTNDLIFTRLRQAALFRINRTEVRYDATRATQTSSRGRTSDIVAFPARLDTLRSQACFPQWRL